MKLMQDTIMTGAGPLLSVMTVLITVGNFPTIGTAPGDIPVNEEDVYPFSILPNMTELGLEIIEGDIAVPRSLLRKGNRPTFLPVGQRWPGNVVPYKYHTSVNNSHKSVIVSGIQHWQNNTCLRFEEVESIGRHHIRFRTDKDGCWSLIGRTMGIASIQSAILGGLVQDLVQGEVFYQDINLQRPGCVKEGTVIHEIGHAIGFYHEQSRSDRDEHIKILFENMNPEMSAQFEKADDQTFGVPYDLGSVMQYPEWAFSKDIYELNTIVTQDPFMQGSLGGDVLTFRDMKLANSMYKCNEGCTNKNSIQCQNGGFIFARHGELTECNCICPPNTAGDLCETIIRPSYYEPVKCGGNVTQPTNIESKAVDAPCIFWVQAPEGQRARVTFTEFNFPARSDKGKMKNRCRNGRLELRTQDHFKGQMFCGDELAGKGFTSAGRNLIIITSKLASKSSSAFKANVSFE
ncbi:blastula protease 10-like [Varroa jacobsoni]|uniref:blastula protease 10-like n=1 Tax=Varroa jacobsoni TaxID=62625 RepID=UPI000BF3A3A0|nr:blastula protease 10-like [Varroa jacobsoni]